MASCHSIVGLNIFINYILEYINVEVVSCHSNRGINIFINYILEFINVEVASRQGSRRINYLHMNYIIQYSEVDVALCCCNKECQTTKPAKFRRLLFAKFSGNLSLWQAGWQCQSCDLNCVSWWFCSVGITNVWRHLFVQWYRLGALRSLKQCADHRVSLLFVLPLFVGVEQSVVMCVYLCACVRQQRPLSACGTVLCHFVNNCNTPVEQAAGDEPRTKAKGATRKP